jgi:hypothetical protein
MCTRAMKWPDDCREEAQRRRRLDERERRYDEGERWPLGRTSLRHGSMRAHRRPSEAIALIDRTVATTSGATVAQLR